MRLVANGDSGTDYCWPTWADYIGLLFDDYVNIGQAGSDNACIVRRQYTQVKAGDIVVILWSGWNRHVKWNHKVTPIPKDPYNHWNYYYERWDKNWLVNFYDPMERFASSMDAVQSVEYQSRALGYTVYHFSAFPWFLGEIEKHPNQQMQDLYNQYNITNDYLLEQSLEEYQKENGYNYIVSHKYSESDTHTTPLCHFNYMKDIILPKIKELSVTQKILDNIQKAAVEHHKMVLAGEVDMPANLHLDSL